MGIANPQLVTYCNEDLRRLADKFHSLSNECQSSVGTYYARDLASVINTAGTAKKVDDNSSVDGRTEVTGSDVFNMVTFMQDFNVFMTQGRKDVLAKWQVHGYE